MTVAVAVLAYEASRLLLYSQTYIDHWAFQLERKAERSLGPAALMSIGLLLAASLYLTAMKSWPGRRTKHVSDETAILLLFGLACLAVHFYGQEMWYWPFAVTGCLFVALAALPALQEIRSLRLLRHGGVFAAAVAVSLATWSLALRERGFMALEAKPSILQQLSSDRTAVVEDVTAFLAAAGVEKTLVTPFFFAELAAYQTKPASLFTFNSLSTTAGADFDSYVRADRNFPIHLSETGMPYLLADYRCKSTTRFSSPEGNFILSVMILDTPGANETSAGRCA